MNYNFYGWESANVPATDEKYQKIADPRELYDMLSEIWCAETCAERMRQNWSADNKTLGQCSVTAFLAQDIFGGKVYGILRPKGNYHCYNVVGDCIFDLTSEQFGDEVLSYEGNTEQYREVHFANEEKRLRYELLKSKLEKRLSQYYRVLKIYEEDYGCEGIPEDSELMCSVLLSSNKGVNEWKKIPDKWLNENNVKTGSFILLSKLPSAVSDC